MKKISIAATVIIAAIALLIGWWDHQHLEEARQLNEEIAAHLSTPSVETESRGEGPAADRPPSRPQRTETAEPGREQRVKSLIAKLTTWEKYAGSKPEERIMSDAEGRTLHQQIAADLLELSEPELRLLIAGARADASLNEEARIDIAAFAARTLAGEHPAEVLALITANLDLFPAGPDVLPQTSFIVAAALAQLSKADPAAAIAWIQANARAHPNLIDDQGKDAAFTELAKQGPKVAFSLLKDLDMTDSQTAGWIIGRGAETPEEQTEVLKSLRDYLPSLDKRPRRFLMQKTFDGLASRAAQNGYDSAMQWLASSSLSPAELTAYAVGFDSATPGPETGKWLAWLEDKLPEGDRSTVVGSLMHEWTNEDYKAAGEWMNTYKDSPLKLEAVRTYVYTVARTDPGVAEQWAMTLPEGPRRQKSLKDVQNIIAEKDDAAAEEFAKRHNLKR